MFAVQHLWFPSSDATSVLCHTQVLNLVMRSCEYKDMRGVYTERRTINLRKVYPESVYRSQAARMRIDRLGKKARVGPRLRLLAAHR